MPLANARHDELAGRLASARLHAVPIARELTSANATLSDAYDVQDALMARAGTLAGWKVGVTSASALARVGIDEPLSGFLERADAVADGGTIDMARLIAPRIEMELAFLVREELRGAGCTADHVIAATEACVPALEIIDARYEPGLFDVVAAVADNMSTARHVLGTQRLDPRAIDRADVTAVLEKNGVEIARGSGANVLGDPATAVAWLVRALAARGTAIAAGSVVLSGGFADALPAHDGDTFVARFHPGGTVSCTFANAGAHP